MKNVTYIISGIDKALAFEWIVEGLDPKKFSLSFVLLHEDKPYMYDYLQQKNIPVRLIEYRGKKDFTKALLQTRKFLKDHKSDIVHCHLFEATFVGLLAARAAGIKKRIYTRHHSTYHHMYHTRMVKWDKFCNALATQIVAISDTVMKVLVEDEGVDPNKVVKIRHGFKLEEFAMPSHELVNKLKQKYNPGHQSPVIGVISRFIEWKGIQYIIPAFEELLKKKPEALLLLFNASGSYTDQLNKLLSRLPAGSWKKISFENEITAAYKLFDVFVHTPIDAHSEAFGQTYIESMAAGIPMVATRSGIGNEILRHENNCLVVHYRSSADIAHAIERILSDGNLREYLIKEGLNTVRTDFTFQEMLRNLEQLYA